jgi:hypothetical protein
MKGRFRHERAPSVTDNVWRRAPFGAAPGSTRCSHAGPSSTARRPRSAPDLALRSLGTSSNHHLLNEEQGCRIYTLLLSRNCPRDGETARRFVAPMGPVRRVGRLCWHPVIGANPCRKGRSDGNFLRILYWIQAALCAMRVATGHGIASTTSAAMKKTDVIFHGRRRPVYYLGAGFPGRRRRL